MRSLRDKARLNLWQRLGINRQPGWPKSLPQQCGIPGVVPDRGSALPTLDESTPPASPLGRFLGWALTFGAVNIGWAFFCMDLRTSLFFLRRLFLG